MDSSRTSPTSLTSTDFRPPMFQCDYPEAVVGNWEVFWEVDDAKEFSAMTGLPDDPTEVTEDAWLAITAGEQVSLEEMV